MMLRKILAERPAWLVPVLVVLGSLLNAATSWLNMGLGSPLFFDSIFTAIVAALVGPLAGIATGLGSHLFMEAFHGFGGAFLPFALCNMATGLIVGLFARKDGLRGVLGPLLCALAVTLANAVIGGMVAFFVFGGKTAHASDDLVTALILAGQSLFQAVFWARIPANLVDKAIAVLAAVLFRLALVGPRTMASSGEMRF